MDLTEFFESVYREARSTSKFNEWWFDSFVSGDFKDRKVSAKIDFYPSNSLYDEFDDHFTVVLYDPSEEKLVPSKAQEAALNNLRKEIQVHFENKMNEFLDENLPDNTVVVDANGYKIEYGDKKFTGPDDSFAEFVIDIDKEKPGAIKGTLIRTYRTKRIESKQLPWRIGLEGVGRVMSYSGMDNVSTESPYIDGLNIPLDRNGIHTEQVECLFMIKIITDEISE